MARLDRIDPLTQSRQHQGEITQQPLEPMWLTTRQAAGLIGCPTANAAASWIRRHGITRRQNGTVSRRDVERELRRVSRRGRHPRSIANLFVVAHER